MVPLSCITHLYQLSIAWKIKFEGNPVNLDLVTATNFSNWLMAKTFLKYHH
jgi:hypothetical protein